MKRFFLILMLLALFNYWSLAAYAADERRPNIIFVLADDLGYTDLACYGSKYYETPNIDKLAATGVRLTDGYSCGANCQPTRAALITGQYGPRTGVYTVGGINRFNWQSRPLRPVDNLKQLPLDKITIAQALKDAGYATGMFGKWHLGNSPAHHPSRRGFDEAIVSAGKHFNFKTVPASEVDSNKYLADFLTDRAVDFIERHQAEPFFLYLPHYAVHSPHQAKEELIAKFKDKEPVGGHKDPTYAAMVASVDESVGRIVAKLDELELSDDTLVIFSSDNGGVGGYPRAGVNIGGITDNFPLKGGKGTFYEGGIRVPYIFNWPGKITGGRTSNAVVSSVDLFPTLLEIAGAEPLSGQVTDGISYANILRAADTPTQREPHYWHFPGYLGAARNQWRTTPCGAIRDGDWKLLEYFEDGHLELYNLKQDIGEEHNLAQDQPEIAKKLHGQLVAWREAVGAKLPTDNSNPTDTPAGKNKGQRRKVATQKS
jgi:arylsulfatase A-like enzyme